MLQVVKVAFYKNYKDTVYDRLISLWTKSKYTHVELIVEGVWYSASPRDGGVRSKGITANLEHWDCVEIALHPYDVEKIVDFFNREQGKKYDWCGIVCSQVIPMKIHHPSKWFCSEIVSHALKLAGVRLSKDNQTYTPISLFNELETIYPLNNCRIK